MTALDDALAHDAAALVAAAAPVIRDACHLAHVKASERIAAAALAPALRGLARTVGETIGSAPYGSPDVAAWLDGLADALDAEAGGGGDVAR